MRNRPLFLQIWLVIAGITTGICILLLIVIPPFLNGYFTREIYRSIEDAQNSLYSGRQQDRLPDTLFDEAPLAERDQEQQNIRSVRHILIRGDGRMFPNISTLPASFKKLVADQALQQKQKVVRYSHQLDNKTIYYTIRLDVSRNGTVYVMSYMWDSHRIQLVRELTQRLFLFMGIVLLCSWIPALWLAKYVSRPLVQLERSVKRLADRDWDKPIDLQRTDEIGRLAQSMEQTRQQLLRQDEAQQSLLQHISHELKTPVMVIRSYAQSIQDGIFPKGDLETSVEVIEHEAERLEKQIRALLYLTKLDYLSTHKPIREPVKLDTLVEEVSDRLRWRRQEIDWRFRLEPLVLQGDREQWTIALENLLDNQIRYAKSQIRISITVDRSGAGETVLAIENDGPPLETPIASDLFEQFRKGPQGEFGLGLAIVKRIAKLHGAAVRAENIPDGVRFEIRFS